MFDTGAWFIHGCPISRVAKPEIKGGIYRIRRNGARRCRIARGESWISQSMPARGVAKLLEDSQTRRSRIGRSSILVQAGPSSVSCAAVLRAFFIDSGRACRCGFRAVSESAVHGIANEAVRAALKDDDFRSPA